MEVESNCVSLGVMNTGLAFQRTRIAPTPSGYLHLGNVLSMAKTVALARYTGARVLLRIDDLDRERVRREYVEDIFATLDYLDIRYDEGPRNYREYVDEYAQQHRLELYNNALNDLRERGLVFACGCSRSDVLQASADGHYTGTCRQKALPLDGAGLSWRLYTDNPAELAVADLGGQVIRAGLPPSMADFIVRKKDGFPAYQLASVVDDFHFGVDLIVRGADLWESSLAQCYLARCLGAERFSAIKFLHHPLLLDADGRKLSKSAGATSVHYLRKQGKSRAEIYRMIGKWMGLEKPLNHWEELV